MGYLHSSVAMTVFSQDHFQIARLVFLLSEIFVLSRSAWMERFAILERRKAIETSKLQPRRGAFRVDLARFRVTPSKVVHVTAIDFFLLRTCAHVHAAPVWTGRSGRHFYRDLWVLSLIANLLSWYRFVHPLSPRYSSTHSRTGHLILEEYVSYDLTKYIRNKIYHIFICRRRPSV